MIVTYSDFINKIYESTINRNMMYYSYKLPYDEVQEYIDSVLAISISEIVEHILEEDNSIEISACDVFQFSNFENCTINLCKLLYELDNPGVSHEQAGMLLLNDGKTRTSTAYTKYGENQLKTGTSLGLLFCFTNTYFLSALGTAYINLDKEKKGKLLARLILRNKLISQMIRSAKNEEIKMRKFLYMLSDATYTRRRSNIKYILRILEESDEYDFTNILNKFIF